MNKFKVGDKIKRTGIPSVLWLNEVVEPKKVKAYYVVDKCVGSSEITLVGIFGQYDVKNFKLYDSKKTHLPDWF